MKCRWIAILPAVLAAAGCSATPPVGSTAVDIARPELAALCADEHGPGIQEMPEDHARLKDLARQAESLMRAGTTAPLAELRKQLDRKRCALRLARPSRRRLTPAEIYRARAGGVLILGTVFKCKKCPRRHARAACAFALSASGACVTNYHVLDKKDDLALVAMTREGKVFPVKEVLAASKDDDVAILRLDTGGEALNPLALSPSAPAVGTPVCVISHPVHRFYTLSCGHVSRYYRRRVSAGRTVPMMAVTADFARGSSGAPVLDDCGNAAGLVSNTQSVYYHIVKGRKENLQMVFKQCVPADRVRRLIGAEDR